METFVPTHKIVEYLKAFRKSVPILVVESFLQTLAVQAFKLGTRTKQKSAECYQDMKIYIQSSESVKFEAYALAYLVSMCNTGKADVWLNREPKMGANERDPLKMHEDTQHEMRDMIACVKADRRWWEENKESNPAPACDWSFKSGRSAAGLVLVTDMTSAEGELSVKATEIKNAADPAVWGIL